MKQNKFVCGCGKTILLIEIEIYSMPNMINISTGMETFTVDLSFIEDLLSIEQLEAFNYQGKDSFLICEETLKEKIQINKE